MTNITTKLRTGDEVVVLAGRDIGKTGTLEDNKIEKIKELFYWCTNMVTKKHTKPGHKWVTGEPVGTEESSIDLSTILRFDGTLKQVKR